MTHSRIRDLYKADGIVVLTLFRTLIMQILHAAALPRDRWGYEAFVLTPMRQSEGFLLVGSAMVRAVGKCTATVCTLAVQRRR